MSITKEQWTKIECGIMNIPGMAWSHNSNFIAESTRRDRTSTYIKFMSDEGKTDDANGNTFVTYMRGKGYKLVQMRPRSCVVSTADLLTEFIK